MKFQCCECNQSCHCHSFPLIEACRGGDPRWSKCNTLLYRHLAAWQSWWRSHDIAQLPVAAPNSHFLLCKRNRHEQTTLGRTFQIQRFEWTQMFLLCSESCRNLLEPRSQAKAIAIAAHLRSQFLLSQDAIRGSARSTHEVMRSETTRRAQAWHGDHEWPWDVASNHKESMYTNQCILWYTMVYYGILWCCIMFESCCMLWI